MKICPACKQIYSDVSLNFCLSDGTVLEHASAGQLPDTLSMPQTVVMPVAPITAGQQETPTVVTFDRTAVYNPAVSAQKSSGTWKWIVGGLATIILLGGIGVFGLIALAVIYGDDPNSNQNNKSTNSEGPVNDTEIVKNEDLSGWRRDENAFGKTSFEDGEFVMSSKSVNYFYVLITPDKEFLTSNSTTKVRLRNITGKPTRLGYGLVVHSDPSSALKRDYAFLIDTVTQSYRVVIHDDKKETDVVKWTKFSAIRAGTETNEISVKDETGKLTLYINGQLATSIKESGDYKQGVAGLYASDAIPIAFSNLQLRK